MATTIDLANLGNAGVRILGGAAGDSAGISVAGGSDVNGDGFLDIMIGATGAGGSYTGAAYVVFGSAGGFASDIDLGALGTGGVTINGVANALTGGAVAMPGDVNNDGIADIVVGNRGAIGGGAGETQQAFVIFGGNGLPTVLTIDSLGANGLTLQGPDGSDSGSALAGAGDVDNDGIPDVLVGAPRGGGEAFLVYGDGALGADVTLSAGPGFTGGGGGFGAVVAGGGDVNGDGIDDFIIGEPNIGAGNGVATVVFGNATRTGVDTPINPIGASGFRLTTDEVGARLGSHVAILRDVNGDDIDDMATVGARADSATQAEAGVIHVIYGSAALGADIDVANLGNTGFKISGVLDGRVAPAGDFNGDGIDDILIGDLFRNKAWVVFGSNDRLDNDFVLSTLADDEGVEITGELGEPFEASGAGFVDLLGTSISGLGDVNGDGFDDILLGAPNADAAGDNAGAAYIIFGFSNAPQTLAGGGDADTLTGGGGNDTISGGGGHDLLIAGGGDDQITGDDGDDRAYGQSGNDLLFGGAGNDSLFGNLGDDEITGGASNDMIRAHVGGDVVMGDAGNDNLFGGGGDDTMTGGAGNDTLGGNSGADMVSGNDGNDTVRGQAGNDTLNGNDGDDIVIGMQGFDMLFGGTGNDTLIGGEANDTLTGGAGVDAFVFAATQGADVIADFEDGTDVISLVGVANFAALTIVDTANGAQITFEAVPTTSITLTDINANQLTAGDFFFS